MIVKGLKEGDDEDTYYRIDFTDGKDAAGNISTDAEFNPGTVGYIPVYRNHLYCFEIGAVDGSGYASFADALKSSGVINNLKCTLHVIDQSGIKDMVFNDQHFLGVPAETGLHTALPPARSRFGLRKRASTVLRNQ